ncbi:hypothetical protein ACVINI_001745 [Rhizobium beringeri]|jgi:hypothetical protein
MGRQEFQPPEPKKDQFVQAVAGVVAVALRSNGEIGLNLFDFDIGEMAEIPLGNLCHYAEIAAADTLAGARFRLLCRIEIMTVAAMIVP